MGTVELRHKLIASINTADDRFLRMVNALYESYIKEDAILEEYPKIFHQLIKKGEEDIKNGRTRSHEEVMTNIKKKYNI